MSEQMQPATEMVKIPANVSTAAADREEAQPQSEVLSTGCVLHESLCPLNTNPTAAISTKRC